MEIFQDDLPLIRHTGLKVFSGSVFNWISSAACFASRPRFDLYESNS
jgi:hypothetical protein